MSSDCTITDVHIHTVSETSDPGNGSKTYKLCDDK